MAVALMMLLVATGSVLFHFFSPWRPPPIASNWETIDDTLSLTFWVTGVGFVGVVLFMAQCLYRFRHRAGVRARYQPENRKLEIWLGVLTSIAVVALLAPGLIVWGRFITVPKDAMVVEAMGAQWQWSFRFPGADSHLGASDARYVGSGNPMGVDPNDPRAKDDLLITSGDLHLPVDTPVKLLLRSIDVVHDFYVPQIRAKMDLMPGLVSYFWFIPTKAGDYEILCAAFCGIGHPQMRGKMVIDTKDDFKKWLAAQQSFAQLRKAALGEKRAAAE